MRFDLKIRRQKDSGSPSFLQTFSCEGDPEGSVAFALNELNNRDELKDKEGNLADRIVWECSCLQKKCGACAMRINGLPCLACSSFLGELSGKEKTIVLEPLSKFSVVADLKVDRSILFEDMKRAKLWLEESASMNHWEHENQYQSSRCLMCGCCLEVCPNFRPDGKFAGAVSMVAASKLMDQAEYGEHRSELLKKYRQFYFEGCGKSLSCQKICPLGLPLEDLLVRSNAAAVWHK
ncbi:2Fe-2S iron-sulfur cluster-binding protein [Clostridium sp. KNHs216]|uniref:2Fe-2S iron-sulfur cluster-binding protein n=1 Tax=Clostridium sp. KNHs216 TaxID=1550235 RepID=UPI0011531869|nr:2Fe-2S iron-sulfur cluster-binding protein [Clostridium sp. KNHs216]TQI66025.1 succinate dehydrogenase / fumarate reductase iron-sulfur subunit [Clostridium sp. KNHs216]